MTLKDGKELDRRCVINWLNEVYNNPSRAFSMHSDEEMQMFAYDALVLLHDYNEDLKEKYNALLDEYNTAHQLIILQQKQLDRREKDK